MELVNLKCLNCGATLVRGESGTAYCPHCGSVYALESRSSQTVVNNQTINNITADTVKINVDNSVNVAPKLRRAFILLEEENYYDAEKILNDVLLFEPENAEAYIGILLAKLELPNKEALLDSTEIYDFNEYRKLIDDIIKFGDGEERAFAIKISLQQKYCKAIRQYESDLRRDVENARKLFEELGDYKDSKSKIALCDKRIKEFRLSKPEKIGIIVGIAAVVLIGVLFLIFRK